MLMQKIGPYVYEKDKNESRTIPGLFGFIRT
jgi:hypothetical protein